MLTRWAVYQESNRDISAFNGRVCSGKTGELQVFSFQGEREKFLAKTGPSGLAKNAKSIQ
jgi:hypothetical protein